MRQLPAREATATRAARRLSRTLYANRPSGAESPNAGDLIFAIYRTQVKHRVSLATAPAGRPLVARSIEQSLRALLIGALGADVTWLRLVDSR